MARAQVCRFYDDGISGTALRRPIKRLPEFQNSSGLFYSSKGRRPPSSPSFLHIPRNALLQALFVLGALLIILVTNVLTSPTVDSSSSTTVKTLGVASVGEVLNALASRTLGSGTSAKGSTPPLRLNVPRDHVKPGVSLVAVCMGRHDTIKKTVPAWLAVNKVNEIIVVDWSSDPPLEPIIRQIPGSERINVIRVNNEPQWVLSRAYNLAINATSYSHAIRTDCDYNIEPGFVEAHRKLIESPTQTAEGKHYYAGNYNLARNENEVHLNGAVFIRRNDFLNVGGYDERIQTYGWDDEDLYNRLGSSGLEKHNISYDHVSHVEHSNSGRAQSGVKFVTVEIDLNSLLLAKLKPWNKDVSSASRYSVGKSSKGNLLEVSAATKPKALKELVTAEEYENAWAEALGRRLHDSYFLPWDIIAVLPIKPKEMLLRRIMGRMENREKAKRAELDAAGRKNEMVDIDSLPTPRVLVCHCMHGLGNRLRALGSCMSYAKESNRELIVVWAPDSHIEAKFSDMYKSPLVVLEKMPVEWPFHEVEKWDAVWGQFKFHNYMEMEGNGAIKGAKILDFPNKHMYYKGAYIMEPENTELTNWDKDNAQLRTLEPIDDVRNMLKQLELKGLGSKDVIGLHVRNRTLEKDIKNVDFIKEYGSEATKTMDMWRHKSGVHNFVKEMNRIIKEKPNVKFFVATDTYEVIGELERIFGAERILSFKRSCDERDGSCVKFAIADLYALAKCKTLYGSNWSSFTEVAMRLGGVKAKLAGEDFGA